MVDTSNLSPDVLAAFNNYQPYGAWSDQNYNTLNTQAGQWTDNFKSQFENLVGRAPTQDEINTFSSQFIAPNIQQLTNPNSTQSQNPNSYIQQFVGQNFHKAAQDYATQQLQGQQDQANSLADLFRTQGNQAISDTEQSLLDYQSKLFDRLRPNLLTSLKAQGLLDTGGLNEAVAGVQGDLANNASNYIAQLKLQNEQGANQIAFGGASAPYLYKQGTITGQPSFLDASGNAASNFNNSTFMNNLDFQHQAALMNLNYAQQANMQPSFLRTLGQSFASGLGGTGGQGAGMFVNGQLFGPKNSGGAGAAGGSPYALAGAAA